MIYIVIESVDGFRNILGAFVSKGLAQDFIDNLIPEYLSGPVSIVLYAPVEYLNG